MRAGVGRGWRLLVPSVAACGGFLLATSAVTAAGTDLRAGPGRLQDLVRQQERALAVHLRQEAELRRTVEAATRAVAERERPVAVARARADALAGAAGLTAVSGPAVTVTLDDAPRQRAGSSPAGSTGTSPRPDDLVVHEQDLQSVVNALWSGGAEAMTLMDRRVISTTAVRCVGNTLLLQGRVYSPPYVITAVGPSEPLLAALDADPGVSIFRQYVAAYGLRYVPAPAGVRTLPAYDGPLDLRFAHP